MSKKRQTQRNVVIAVVAGNVDAIERWLNAGGDPNLRDSEHGETLLMLGCEFAHERVVNALLSAGADVNAQDSGGRTPVIHAVRGGAGRSPGARLDVSLRIVDDLLRHGADINIADSDGWSPVFFAVSAGNAELLSQLRSRGADAEVKTAAGESLNDIANQMSFYALSDFLNRPSSAAASNGESERSGIGR